MNEALIYDFEGIVEPAAKTVLTGLGIDSFTAQDDPQFQKGWARCEIKYTHGSGLSRFVTIINGQNVQLNPAVAVGVDPKQLFYCRRESVWACSLRFALITAADPQIHGQWRAVIRSALAQLWTLINGTALTRHTLQLTKDGGNSEPMLSTDQALFRTDFTFDGTISVNADAWSVLFTDTPQT